MSAWLARRYRVRGIVQGVGFRWHTREVGSSLGLRGWVRNLPDGSVEAWAAGPADAIDRFERFLGHGPPASSVAEVAAASLSDDEADGLPHPFAVFR